MKKIILSLSFLSLIAFTACHRGGNSLTLPPKGTAAPSGDNKPTSDCNPNLISFTDVQPIFEKNCKLCHAKGGPLPDWSDYQISFSLKDRLLDRVVVKKDMPLGQPLAKEDLDLITAWLNDGAIEKSCDPNKTTTPPAQPTPPSPGAPNPTEPIQPEPPATPEPPPSPQPQPPPTPEEPLPAPSFQKDIKPLVKTYCVMCHAANGPLPDWNDPAMIAQKKPQLWDRVVVKQDMPMGIKMMPQELELFKRWLEAGAPTSP